VNKVDKLSQDEGHFKELLHGAATAFILKVFAAGIAFFLNIIISRGLGAEGAGVYFLALSIVIFIAAIGRLGMELVLVRQIAENVKSNNQGRVLGVYRIATLYTVTISILFSIALYYFTPWISLSLFSKPELENPLSIMALSIVPTVLLILNAHALQGLKKIASSTIVSSLIVPLLTSIFTIAFVKEYGIDSVVWGFFTSSVVAMIIGWLIWIKSSKKFRKFKPEMNKEVVFKSSSPLLGIVIMNMIINLSPMFLLGIWESSENIGIYGAASRTAMLTSFVLMAVNSISAPKFAELYKMNKIYELENICKKSTKLMIYTASPVLAIFIIFPELILSIFGEEFKNGAIVLIILSIGQLINVSTGSVGYLLTMTGHERTMHRIMLFSSLIGLSSSVILISQYGIIGASISVTLALSVQNLLAMTFVWKKLKIITFPWLEQSTKPCSNNFKGKK